MNTVLYYWVKHIESGINEICIEIVKPNKIVFYKVFDDEYMYNLDEFREYYTFICEVEPPNP